MDVTSGIFGSAMGVADFLYTIAGIIFILSFLARDILWLRTIFMGAALLNAISGAIMGLYSVIVWDIGYCAVHLIQIIWLILERKPFLIPPDLRPTWEAVFNPMTPGQFLRFWKTGQVISGENVSLCTDGESCQNLMFIYSGTARVSKGGKELATVKEGSFLGEMSFLTGETASADVITEGNVKCMAWSQEELHKLKSSRPEVYNKLIAILGVDVVHKLQSQNKTTQEAL